jgi:hypothetical protein
MAFWNLKELIETDPQGPSQGHANGLYGMSPKFRSINFQTNIQVVGY